MARHGCVRVLWVHGVARPVVLRIGTQTEDSREITWNLGHWSHGTWLPLRQHGS